MGMIAFLRRLTTRMPGMGMIALCDGGVIANAGEPILLSWR